MVRYDISYAFCVSSLRNFHKKISSKTWTKYLTFKVNILLTEMPNDLKDQGYLGRFQVDVRDFVLGKC